jgi:cysteine-rich repeat protein
MANATQVRALLGAVFVGGLLGACLEPSGATCADGSQCAGSKVCAPVGAGCVDPAQVEACRGLAPGAACDLPGIGAGACRDEVCVVQRCGDGVLDPGEGCDDGEANAPDGACLPTCARPTCGDGAIQGDEACDDGELGNGDDRACLPTCVAASCGDGRVWAGVEACDAGAGNDDAGACTGACATASCGDGRVWAGVEACDDGNQASADGCRADCRKVETCGDALLDDGEACDDGNGNPLDGCDGCVVQAWRAEALVAGRTDPLAVELGGIARVAAGLDGSLTFTASQRVWRLADGVLSVVAGTGGAGSSGDGGPAPAATFFGPRGVAVDGLGHIAVADQYNHRVRFIDLDGRISTIVGTGEYGDGEVELPGPQVALAYPADVAFDGFGNVLVADTVNSRVLRSEVGTTTTSLVAGVREGFDGDGGPAVEARLNNPESLAMSRAGDLYIWDAGNSRIRRIDGATGIIDTIAGNGAFGHAAVGEPALAQPLSDIAQLAVTPDDAQLLVTHSFHHEVRALDLVTGVWSVVAGTGVQGASGDGGPPSAATLNYPSGLAATVSGEIVIGSSNTGRLRAIASDGSAISTIAGALPGSRPAGLLATSTPLEPAGLALAPDGAGVLIAEPAANRISRVSLDDGLIETVIGSGAAASSGDGGPAALAEVSGPSDVMVAPDGTIYVVERGGARVRRVDAATGEISTVAGTGTHGFGGDGGPATAAQLSLPCAAALAADGALLISDRGNHRVRRVDPTTNIISTLAGNGVATYAGDGGPAVAASLRSPCGLAVAGDGGVLIADLLNLRIRRVAADGTIATIAGTGTQANAGDGGPATAASFLSVNGVAVDAVGDVYVSDSSGRRVRRIDHTTGIISTYAGDGNGVADGDGRPPAESSVPGSGELVFGVGGDWFLVTDAAVRAYAAAPDRVWTLAGAIDPRDLGRLTSATLTSPRALDVAGALLLATGEAGVLEHVRDGEDIVRAVAGRYPNYLPVPGSARYQGRDVGQLGGVARDVGAGVIYVSEATGQGASAPPRNWLHVITPVDPADERTWTIEPLAGAAEPGYVDGPAGSARFRDPTGLYLDEAAGILYVADRGNHAIRAVDLATRVVSTVAGTGATLGFFGDGGAALDALLFAPTAVTRCAATGDLFIADTGNHRVRRVAAGSGVISTVLGDGVAASSGQGAPAWLFPVDSPAGLACDARGNLAVTSRTTVRLLPAAIALGEVDGVVDGSGPVQTIYGAAPRTDFPASVSACLSGVAFTPDDALWVTDACAGLLVELRPGPADAP